MVFIKIFLIALFIFAIFTFVIYSTLDFEDKTNDMEKKESRVYQGPVPEGFDEEHFRKTGETKPLEK